MSFSFTVRLLVSCRLFSFRRFTHINFFPFHCLTTILFLFSLSIFSLSPSQWPRGRRHELYSPARTLGSWVRIPHEVWMSVCIYSSCCPVCG
jgi:hypothetical protein